MEELLEKMSGLLQDIYDEGHGGEYRPSIQQVLVEYRAAQQPRAADGAIEPIKCAECGDEIYPVCDACVGDMRHR